MITLITGAPGGGKSYLAVKHLLDKYFVLDKETKYYRKKEEICIVTNIDGLKLEHESLSDWMVEALTESGADLESMGPLEKRKAQIEAFWAPEYQTKLMNRYGSIVYLIDEAQQYFDSRFGRLKSARNVLLYFETHRHFGADIFLITQDARKLCMDLRVLAEKEIRALPRSLNIFKEMKYNEYVNGMKANGVPKCVRPSKRIFALYKSMDAKENEKVRSPLRRLALGCAVGLVIGFAVLWFGWFRRHGEAIAATTTPKNVAAPANPAEHSAPVPMKVTQRRDFGASKPGWRWVELDFCLVRQAGRDRVRVICPRDGVLKPLSALGLDVMRDGNQLFAKVDLETYQAVQARRGLGRSERASAASDGQASAPRPDADRDQGN